MASHVKGQNDVATRRKVETVMLTVPLSSCSASQLSNPRKLSEGDFAFKRSGAPARFMFYRTGSWFNFPSDVVESIQSGFSEGKPMMDVSIEGSRFVFDFRRMLQIDFATGNQRSIAWIDKNGECFFPREFVSEEFGDVTGVPTIQIEIRVDGNSCKRKGEELEAHSNGEEEEVSSSKRPCLAPADSETPRWPSAKPLSPGEEVYSVVSNLFMNGIRKIDNAATITAIRKYKPSGPLERARFEVFLKQMEIVKAARGVANAIYAWYAASAKDVSVILSHGFSVPSKVSGSGNHGVGLYLYPLGLPHISALQSKADDNGEKHMILCRVIMGNVEKVEAGSQQSHPSSEDFDTGADDPKNPKRFVVWFSDMNRNILPECVVSYKSSDHLPGQVRGLAKYPFWKLFSKMKGSLPVPKMQEAMTLYEAFRAGKVARDIFVKRLQSVVGQHILKSTIREIIASE